MGMGMGIPPPAARLYLYNKVIDLCFECCGWPLGATRKIGAGEERKPFPWKLMPRIWSDNRWHLSVYLLYDTLSCLRPKADACQLRHEQVTPLEKPLPTTPVKSTPLHSSPVQYSSSVSIGLIRAVGGAFK